MIGVICKPEEELIAREFFQLFKTPWEFFQPGTRYDVILATTDDLPDIDTPLIILYGSQRKSVDERMGIAGRGVTRAVSLVDEGKQIPIYGNLLNFDGANGGVFLRTETDTVGLRANAGNSVYLRVGYDLFSEVCFLLTAGQPIDNASIPTLDLHIDLLRRWILREGFSLVEIPPTPANHTFIACLTHDIDFIGIRRHVFDHSALGFLYRATVGSLRNFAAGRLPFGKLLHSWKAAASLPFVYLDWAKDFWEPFEWYLETEKNLPATYFLIPFKRQAGERVPGKGASKRATAYDVSDITGSAAKLLRSGCELGVHGIDSWHSVEKGRVERDRVVALTGKSSVGIRMHWLLNDQNTARVLEDSGYAYDSTAGYNETVGYRNGTSQAYRPIAVQTLLELPMHIQDGALFYPQRLNLREEDAWNRCESLLGHARETGGVVTLLWHDRSHGPERFWGDFYLRLIDRLKGLKPWFATAADVVRWFRKRREIQFRQQAIGDGILSVCILSKGDKIVPPAVIRVHRPTVCSNKQQSAPYATSECIDIPWEGGTMEVAGLLAASPIASQKAQNLAQ